MPASEPFFCKYSKRRHLRGIRIQIKVAASACERFVGRRVGKIYVIGKPEIRSFQA
jgi:hypothetical protein